MTRLIVVNKYSREIDSLVRSIRKWKTSLDAEPGSEELMAAVEDAFFAEKELLNVEIPEIRVIIDSVYRRVAVVGKRART